MNKLISYVNNNQFTEAYEMLRPSLNTNSNPFLMDFLFACQPDRAYAFLQFCLCYANSKIIRIAICNLLAYGDVEIADYHTIIYENIWGILREDMHSCAALEFALYNYWGHPRSPFTDDELLLFANNLLEVRNDPIAKKCVKEHCNRKIRNQPHP